MGVVHVTNAVFSSVYYFHSKWYKVRSNPSNSVSVCAETSFLKLKKAPFLLTLSHK